MTNTKQICYELYLCFIVPCVHKKLKYNTVRTRRRLYSSKAHGLVLIPGFSSLFLTSSMQRPLQEVHTVSSDAGETDDLRRWIMVRS